MPFDRQRSGKPGEERLPDRSTSPHLFSVFLDPTKSVEKDKRPVADGVDMRPVSFGFDVRVLVPDYEGGFIYRELILIEAEREEKAEGGWKIRYGFQKDSPSVPNMQAETRPLENERGLTFSIPIQQEHRLGLTGTLRIEARPWM